MDLADTAIKSVTPLLAIATFAWGIYQYSNNQKGLSETRRIEATKPFLDRQLALYTAATQAAATIATSSSAPDIESAMARFWSLYWGELALVEDREVEGRMKAFGDALARGDEQGQLQSLSLRLAHACRNSIGRSWRVAEWASQY